MVPSAHLASSDNLVPSSLFRMYLLKMKHFLNFKRLNQNVPSHQPDFLPTSEQIQHVSVSVFFYKTKKVKRNQTLKRVCDPFQNETAVVIFFGYAVKSSFKED